MTITQLSDATSVARRESGIVASLSEEELHRQVQYLAYFLRTLPPTLPPSPPRDPVTETEDPPDGAWPARSITDPERGDEPRSPTRRPDGPHVWPTIKRIDDAMEDLKPGREGSLPAAYTRYPPEHWRGWEDALLQLEDPYENAAITLTLLHNHTDVEVGLIWRRDRSLVARKRQTGLRQMVLYLHRYRR